MEESFEPGENEADLESKSDPDVRFAIGSRLSAMRHWIDDLYDREQNQKEKEEGGDLGRLAYDRVRDCIELCLKRYNDRHKPTVLEPILSRTVDDGTQMAIHVGKHPRTISFVFFAKRPIFKLDELAGEIVIENGLGRMDLVLSGNGTPIENVVRAALQPILFPTIPKEKDKLPEYYLNADLC